MTRTFDIQRFAVITLLACLGAYLAHLHGFSDDVKAIVTLILTLVAGWLRPPVVHTPPPSVSVQADTALIPIEHEEPKP
jgi:hypothetical protein